MKLYAALFFCLVPVAASAGTITLADLHQLSPLCYNGGANCFTHSTFSASVTAEDTSFAPDRQWDVDIILTGNYTDGSGTTAYTLTGQGSEYLFGYDFGTSPFPTNIGFDLLGTVNGRSLELTSFSSFAISFLNDLPNGNRKVEQLALFFADLAIDGAPALQQDDQSAFASYGLVTPEPASFLLLLGPAVVGYRFRRKRGIALQ